MGQVTIWESWWGWEGPAGRASSDTVVLGRSPPGHRHRLSPGGPSEEAPTGQAWTAHPHAALPRDGVGAAWGRHGLRSRPQGGPRGRRASVPAALLPHGSILSGEV